MVLVGLAVNAAVLLFYSQKIWFWADDWDLLFLRGTIPSESIGLFEPHNHHWLTAHILVYRGLFEVFGMRSYLPFAATEIAFHLATCLVAYLVLRRVGAHAWAAAGGSLMIAFFGLGANAQIFSATMNHVGSLLCGMAALYALVRLDDVRRAATVASAALLLSVMFSGTGLSVAVLVFCFGVAQHGWRLGARLVALPAVAFIAWYLAYGRSAEQWGGSADLVQLPGFVWQGLTATLADGSGLVGAGPVLLMALVLALLTARPDASALLHLAAAGLVADVCQLLLVSYGRFGFGAAQLGQSHYAYINIVLLTPAVVLAVQTLLVHVRRPAWVTGIVTVAVFAAYVAHGLGEVRAWHDDFALITSANDEIALGVVSAAEAGQRVLTQRNPDGLNHQFIPRYLLAPEIREALPQREATPDGRLYAESTFFVGVGTRDYELAGPVDLEVLSGFEDHAVDRPGCHDTVATAAEPILEMDTGEGNEIVVWSTSTTIKTQLHRDGRSGPLREWSVSPGPVHIATSARDAVLNVSFNGTGVYTICKQ